jgi:ribosomal protein S28E/S33
MSMSGKGEKTMKLTKRGQKVVVIAIVLGFMTTFLSGIAVARTLMTKSAIAKPAIEQTEQEIALKDKKALKKVEHLRNKAVLSDQELVDVLKHAGFEGNALKVAWAIVKKESNGRPVAFNGNVRTGDNSYGIFQINMIGDLGEERRKKFELSSNAELFDPITNAQIAYRMSAEGTNWSAWKGLTPKVKAWLKKFPKQ